MGIHIGGLIGLIGGAICGLSGWYFGRRGARKQGELDEVHDHIWQKARSTSWYVTLIALYILFFLYAFGVPLSTPASLGLLLFAHLFSWAISGLILSSTIYNESKGDRQIYTFLMLFFLLFALIIIVLILTGKLVLFED